MSGAIRQDQTMATASNRVLDIIDDGCVALLVLDKGAIDILDDTGSARVGFGVVCERRVMDDHVPDHSVTGCFVGVLSDSVPNGSTLHEHHLVEPVASVWGGR